MKVALLHYWLTNIRGGEKVFLELCNIFPEADIYTHVISSEIKKTHLQGRKVFTSYINSLPCSERLYKCYMPLMPAATANFKLDNYDLIISSESGPIKGIKKPEGVRHLCYCHTPMRYIWDMFDDYFKYAPWYKKIAMLLFKKYLRYCDIKSAESVNDFIANSNFVKERIRRVYNRDSRVIYPPVNVDYFGEEVLNLKEKYYLLAGELVKYKRPDIAIEAFNRSGKRLIVAGIGEELIALKAAANTNISFVGRASDRKLRKLYSNAQALVFPGIEDFGIVPVEAQATGTPVIAYGAGGALETVIADKTGLFFFSPEADALCNAIEEFESKQNFFSKSVIREHSVKFSTERFRAEIFSLISAQ
ncbi:MAG: glycosyltransferase family 4 protein [Lentisphaerae bacterium]|nr:glycosyltransferase family 4 protein [Lentisphaerota bacterium]MCP4102639.1 glycosyltransferase family 4 protein [Lentisphaerota bacterium]